MIQEKIKGIEKFLNDGYKELGIIFTYNINLTYHSIPTSTLNKWEARVVRYRSEGATAEEALDNLLLGLQKNVPYVNQSIREKIS